ncbi:MULTISPECIES: mechanosensitive ion channel family protein [Paracoccaceae]|jgi:small-conductance mechanosensitive channel|uniref:mechanosensitive ion channel family protein n=1 Tax=Rhodobacterales TaxID=204455 RepID=UPI001B17F03D|nr:mechanosensitive ion channel domain-containing protein [Boseongicola sp. H5]MBO6602474.1 mechanosensitive ion channel [Roseicyclus sp.]MBO6624433.1 mechanosensitive ion channel [Roseicyclus sp.]MBO6920644.1 mechanosensitive ion channel [Roseicyclus sp.]
MEPADQNDPRAAVEAPPEPPELGGEEALNQALELGQELFEQGTTLFDSLLRPWNFYQLCIAVGLVLVAILLRRLLGPRIRAWMASREGWPKWRMRVLVVVHRRLMPIFFVILIWLAVWIMREFTWPSRSYLLGIIAELATAWLFVVFVTRLIRSPVMRTLVRYGAWIYVTLAILNARDEAAQILDSVGFQLGDVRLSLLLVVQGIVILAALVTGARFISGTTAARVQANEDISPSMRVLVVKAVQVLLYGAAFFIGLRAIGVDLTGLAVLSGAIGVGLGFGLQKVVSNLVSGVIILLDKSIKPGDVISLGDTFGWINTLGARYASVVTRDGREYLIPNEDLITNQVVNWSHSNEFVRLDIYFGTAYHDDPHSVREIAIEAARGVDRVLSFRPPVCHIVGFGDSSVDYILRFWIRDPTGGLTNIRGNVYLALWDAFREHGISIPFPQREVKVLEGSSLETRQAD